MNDTTNLIRVENYEFSKEQLVDGRVNGWVTYYYSGEKTKGQTARVWASLRILKDKDKYYLLDDESFKVFPKSLANYKGERGAIYKAFIDGLVDELALEDSKAKADLAIANSATLKVYTDALDAFLVRNNGVRPASETPEGVAYGNFLALVEPLDKNTFITYANK